MKTITADTKDGKYENSWLECGEMRDGKWVAASFRYPQGSKKLTVKRTYETWTGGDGRFTTTHWTIQSPDDYKLQIAKVTRGRKGADNQVEIIG